MADKGTCKLQEMIFYSNVSMWPDEVRRGETAIECAGAIPTFNLT